MVAKHKLTPLLIGGALSGALWWLMDLAMTLGLGFKPQLLRATLEVSLFSLLLMSGLGASAALGLGLAQAALGRLKIGWSADQGLSLGQRAIPARWALGALCAGLTGSLCFLYGYTLAAPLGFAVVGEHGLGKPVTPALAGLLAALVLVPLALTPLLAWAFGRSKRALHIVWGALWAALAIDLFFFLYDVAKATLIDLIYFALTLTLLIWSLPLTARLGERLLERVVWLKRLRVPLAIFGVLAALMTKPVLDRVATHEARMTLYERMGLTSNALYALSYARRAPAPRLTCPADAPPLQYRLEPAQVDAQEPIRGVVLIMVDALRGDRLDYERPGHGPLMPNLKRLASRSRYFPNAYATGPGTIRATMSLMYGRYHKHGHEQPQSLISRLGQAGVKTWALPNHHNVLPMLEGVTVRDDALMKLPRHRFAVTSQQVYERSAAFLDQLKPDERFFHYIHYYDPHEYYVHNDLYNFGRDDKALYDAEVANVDHWVGKYLERLASSPVAKNTLVIIMSDHGDELHEHRYVKHGYRLYDESVRVLSIVHDPRQGPARVEAPVALVDLTATIAQAFDIKLDDQAEGVSLLGTPKGLEQRPVFLYWHDSAGVVYGRHKLLVHNKEGFKELYDLSQDPHERRNLADGAPSPMPQMECMLDQWLGSLKQRAKPAP